MEPSQALQVLKANIEDEITDLEPDVLRVTIQNAIKRAQMCINSGGGLSFAPPCSRNNNGKINSGLHPRPWLQLVESFSM